MDSRVTETIRKYFMTQPIQKAWVFGSFSRGEEREDSDIDILVSLTPNTQLGLGWIAMICDLEDLLHRPVDLVKEGCIQSYAQESVNRDKILIYERAS